MQRILKAVVIIYLRMESEENVTKNKVKDTDKNVGGKGAKG